MIIKFRLLSFLFIKLFTLQLCAYSIGEKYWNNFV